MSCSWVSVGSTRALDVWKLPPPTPNAFAKFTFDLESVFLGKCNPYVSDSLALHL